MVGGWFFYLNKPAEADFKKFTNRVDDYSLIYSVNWQMDDQLTSNGIIVFYPKDLSRANWNDQNWILNIQTAAFSSVERAEAGLNDYLEKGGIKAGAATLSDERAFAGFNERRGGIYQILIQRGAKTYVLEMRPADGKLTPEQKKLIESFKFE